MTTMSTTTLTTNWTEVTTDDALPAGAVSYSDGQIMSARMLRAGETVDDAREDALSAYDSDANRREVRRTFAAV